MVFCCYAGLGGVLVECTVEVERRCEGWTRRTVFGRACSSRADWRCHSSLDVKYGIVNLVCVYVVDEWSLSRVTLFTVRGVATHRRGDAKSCVIVIAASSGFP